MIDQFLKEDILSLKELGFIVEVAANFEKGNTCSQNRIAILKSELKKNNVEYFQIDFSRNIMDFKENLKAYKQLDKIVSNGKYEFIHSHSPIGGVVSRITAFKNRVKIIYTAHGFHFFKGSSLLNWLLYFPIEKFLSFFTDVLITINKEDYNNSIKLLNAKKNVYLPGIGIDADKLNAVNINKKKLLDSLGITENSFLIISVGELNKNKNHQVVVKALYRIKNPNIHYLICGQGPEIFSLREMVIKLNLSKNVHFLGYREDVKEILKISDLFIFPSYREGLSVALMEAMTSRLPVICSNIRGNVDLITEGENGYLVSPNDDVKIANCIEELYKDSNLSAVYGSKNYNKIVENFSLTRVKELTKDIYREV